MGCSQENHSNAELLIVLRAQVGQPFACSARKGAHQQWKPKPSFLTGYELNNYSWFPGSLTCC